MNDCGGGQQLTAFRELPVTGHSSPFSHLIAEHETMKIRTLRVIPLIALLSVSVWGQAVLHKKQSASTQQLATLFIIGDSTVNNHTQGLLGWGDPIAASFDTVKIIVENRARGGRSSRTFLTEGLWDQALTAIKPGDFVLIQFGHNDGGPLNTGRARASLKGTGDETQEVVMEATGNREVVHTYGWYLRKYITDTKARGATPVVLSPVPRNIWKDDKVIRASTDYGKWAAEAAKAGSALFIDLNEIVAKRYEDAGAEKVKRLYFGDDHTHTTEVGAQLNADSVIKGLRGLKDCKLCRYLVTQTK